MRQQQPPDHDTPAGPRFYVTPRRSLSPGVVLLAFAIAVSVLFAALHLRSQARHRALEGREDDDDPSRVDTIYLGDPHEAPVATRPAAHPAGRPGAVHPFVMVKLPRGGDGAGQIPDTASGRLLYGWLAAFNGSDPSALSRALPTAEAALTEAAQVKLRRQTGGFQLDSAREIQPGVLVFRLHDQTLLATEALGTLQVQPGSNPARIGSFSLRSVAPPSPVARPK